MLHAKAMVIDDCWVIVGSANFDNRSFPLNDEILLSVFNSDFAAKHTKIFRENLGRCEPFTYLDWRKRGLLSRGKELFSDLLRQKRVGDEAGKTPKKTSEQRQRSVQLGVAEAKAAAKVYLADQYTNSNGQMICQACKDELPFKLPTGAYYFEAVKLVADSPKHYRETYLALCPNHAAAYLYANEQRNSINDLVVTAKSNEIEIALGGDVTTLFFTQMHLVDIKACLYSDETEG